MMMKCSETGEGGGGLKHSKVCDDIILGRSLTAFFVVIFFLQIFTSQINTFNVYRTYQR